MAEADSSLSTLRLKLEALWGEDKAARSDLIARDDELVEQVRNHMSDVARILLSATGEQYRLDGSDRYLDIYDSVTRLTFDLVQDSIRQMKVAPLSVAISIGGKMVSVDGKPQRVRSFDSIAYDIMESVAAHYDPLLVTDRYAGDYFHIIKR